MFEGIIFIVNAFAYAYASTAPPFLSLPVFKAFFWS